jgi:hypothetical protein
MINPLQKRLLDITQHAQETEIHAPNRIQTRNPTKQAAADPHLRPLGHWVWHKKSVLDIKCKFQALVQLFLKIYFALVKI